MSESVGVNPESLGSLEVATADDFSQANLNSAVADTLEESIDSANINKALNGEFQVAAPEQQPAEEVAEESDELEATDEQVDDEPKKLSPYQKRVQGLINERKQLEQAMQQRDAYYQNQLQHLQSQLAAQQEAQQRQQDELLRKQLDLLERRAREEEDAKLSDVERARRKFLAEAEERAMSRLRPEIEEAKQKAAQVEAFLAAQREQAEQQARVSKWAREIQQTLESQVLKGFDTTEAKSLSGEAEEMVAAYAGAYGISPAEAAVKLQDFLRRYSKAEMKRISKSAGSKVAQSQAAPKPLPAGRAGSASVSRVPTLGELRAAGFEDHIAWRRHGSPPVSRAS